MTIEVLHEAGDRFRIRIRDHELVVDQPGSGDAGPTPTELFVASLISCTAFFARRFLARRGVADGELQVSGEMSWAPDHSRVTGITMRVESARGIPADLHDALQRVVDHCTVSESIRGLPELSWEFSAAPLESTARAISTAG